jgi:hypothetical protein
MEGNPSLAEVPFPEGRSTPWREIHVVEGNPSLAEVPFLEGGPFRGGKSTSVAEVPFREAGPLRGGLSEGKALCPLLVPFVSDEVLKHGE